MFCAKCGKQIDDDSKFCPFCGDVSGSEAPRQKKAAAKKPVSVNLVVFGVIAVILIAAGVFLFMHFRRNPVLDKLFEMKWSEISDMTGRSFRDKFDDEKISYKYSDDDYGWALTTNEEETFFDASTLYGVSLGVDFDRLVYEQTFLLGYETRDEYMEGCKTLEDSLGQKVIENTSGIDVTELLSVTGAGGGLSSQSVEDVSLYIIDKSSEEAEVDKYMGILEESQKGHDAPGLEMLSENSSDYSVYKFAVLLEGKLDDMAEEFGMSFNSGDGFSNRACALKVVYAACTEKELIPLFTLAGWDMIAGSEIDTGDLEASMDISSALGNLTDAQLEMVYRILYMLETHDFDFMTGETVNEEGKDIWYIVNLGYDRQNNSAIDLSEYMNSKGIYCAVNYNYDLDNHIYFESSLDRALYLANMNYNMETRSSFVNDDEKRLWVMVNYGYDIVVGKEVDKAIGEALIAYQEYVDMNMGDLVDKWTGYTLAYVNDDNVPECLVWTNPYLSYYGNELMGYKYLRVLSYSDNTIQAYESKWFSGCETIFMYNPRKNVFCIDEILGLRGAEQWSIAELTTSFREEGFISQDYDYFDNMFYSDVRRRSASTGEYEWVDIDANTYLDSFGLNTVLDEENAANSILAAYDDLRTTVYYANMPELDKFELSNGILTVSTNDGSRYGWKAYNPFSISYPVADNCIWEQGWYSSDFVKERDISYEELRKTITSEFEWYESLIQENGEEWFNDNRPIESPLGIQITVTDGVVVSVRVSGS